jgi:ribosomal protein L11 methyltransferase
MPFLQLTLACEKKEAEDLSDLLFELSALSVTFEDAADQPIFEPTPGTVPIWEKTNVVALFDMNINLSELETSLAGTFPNSLANKKIEHIEDQAWETAYLAYFQPIQMTENLWICPTWHEPPAPDAITIFLDPGLAFGTGTHPTTQLCLRALARHPLENYRVIDYGCGSGILAIAALKLGATHAYGVDIHEQALEASAQNATTNKCLEQLTLSHPDTLFIEPVDCIVANILAEPLMMLSDQLIERLNTNGLLILSGLLDTQAARIIEKYAALRLIHQTQQEEWVCLEFIKD